MRLAPFFIGAANFVLAGCAAATSSTSTAALPSVAVQTAAMRSYVEPAAGKKSALIYVGNWATNEVFVYDYATGKSLGTLTGFSDPYGMCVDAKGDIYIASFGGGDAVEFAHGGSKVINTYNSGGEPIGCSVDAKGDVAVTSFTPGELTVFARGDPAKATTYTGPCAYFSSMGYDAKGNLVGTCETSTGSFIAIGLLKRSKSLTVLSGCCEGIGFGSTMWDGEYFVFGSPIGVVQMALSGKTLTERGETVLCNNSVGPWFVVGNKNTPVNRTQGKVLVGFGSCRAGIAFWHYPAGGYPFKAEGPGGSPGIAVSLKN